MTVIDRQSSQILNDILTSGSVQSSIEIIARRYGIEYVTFHMISTISTGIDNPFVRTTYPAQWVSHYLLNNFVNCDPILRKARKSNTPFCWDEIEPNSAETRLFRKAQEFGLGAQGFSIPSSDPLGRKSVMSLNSAMSDSDWSTLIAHHRDDLLGLATDVHLQAVAEAYAEQDDLPKLSPREYECLRWTSEGKTYSEIAIILDLSEHTVRSYLRVVRLKLDSVSLAQAVGRASRIGLI